jgi:hypothetical protein
MENDITNNDPILLRVDNFIWGDQSLNYPEKIILNLIFSFTIREECCTLSDVWIANKFGWTSQFVKEIVQLLANRGWVIIHPQWDGSRTLSIHIPGKPDPCDQSFPVDGIEV